MTEKRKTLLEDISDKAEQFANERGMKLGPNSRNSIERMVRDVAQEEGINIETGPDGEPIMRVQDHRARRWNELAGLEEPGVRPVAQAGEPPPFSIPIRDLSSTIEVAPGILVSQHLIREAVAATADPGAIEDVERREEMRERAKQELREDLKASQQVVQEMFEKMRNPPNMKEKYVSFDAMPKPLQRVVQAYIGAAEANKELEEAIKALASTPPTE